MSERVEHGARHALAALAEEDEGRRRLRVDVIEQRLAELMARSVEPEAVAPQIVAEAPTVTPAAPPPVQQAVQPPPAAAPAPAPAMEVSLGATLIASGVVRKPVLAANDPLAPIRRMSQAEKIAFFS